MRILMASKRAPGTPGRRDGGVQTWTLTVAAELRRLRHEVDVVPGVAAVDPGYAMASRERYDFGIFANASHTRGLLPHCRASVLVSHGIVPDESPGGGFDALVFTSEEVREYWRGPDATDPVIRQPIDLEFWSPGKRRAGRTLVRYANRGGLEWLPEVAARLGLQFVHVRNATPAQARDMLRDAACVLASGRCAVEAMACGAPVVVCDDRPYQGPLMDYTSTAMLRNYSGRGGEAPDELSLARRIDQAMAAPGWREYAERHHDVREIVRQLLGAACCTC